MTHPAWDIPEAEWVPLAPGVKWLLRRPDGVDQKVIAAEVAAILSRAYAGRAALEELGLDVNAEGGPALDLDRIAGYASVLTAFLYATRCLQGWTGIDDPATGQPLAHDDVEAVRAALIHGAPPRGVPLLPPFLAWIEGERQPMAAEAARLRRRAKDYWGGGAERCLACRDAGDVCAKGGSEESAVSPGKREICPQIETAPQTAAGIITWALATSSPGLWERAGMGGQIVGLKYGDALLAYEAECGRASSAVDHGSAFAAYRAIELGCLEALTQKAKDEADADG